MKMKEAMYVCSGGQAGGAMLCTSGRGKEDGKNMNDCGQIPNN